MRLSQIVTAPNGQRWRVGRRWMARPLPNPWRKRRRRRDRDGKDKGSVLDWLDVPALDGAGDLLLGIGVAIAVAVIVALFAFVLLPLIGVAFELAVVLSLSASGALGSVFLGRPWTIEAVRLGEPAGTPVVFAVKGWQRSRHAIRAVARAIETTGEPPHAAEPALAPG
jgi:hypothetical protein